ncbi:MAG: S-layer homology domain-containing protein [Clostridia bacterium]|nr:S-layer homology domain-containing protein [Clostridia bacterium]
MKKILILFVVLLFNVSYAAFSDVPYDHWSYSAVNKMENLQILSGYPDGTFRPNNYITFAEFTSIFDNFFDIPKDNSSNRFSGVSSEHWGKGSVEAALKYIDPNYDSIAEYLGYTGYTTEDGIVADMPVTREIVIHAFYTIFGYEERLYNKDDEKFMFADYQDMMYPKEICIAYKKGVISGENVEGDIYIRPTRYITRAEISAIFNNLLGFNTKIKNLEGYDIFEKVLNDYVKALKNNNLNEAKTYIYDTNGVLNAIDFNEVSDKNLTNIINKWCKTFSFSVVEHGFYSYNHAYLKIKANKIDTNALERDFNLRYQELTTQKLKSKLENFDFTRYHQFNEMGTNMVINFVKVNDKWKIEL